jgi:hypothetical protein
MSDFHSIQICDAHDDGAEHRGRICSRRQEGTGAPWAILRILYFLLGDCAPPVARLIRVSSSFDGR